MFGSNNVQFQFDITKSLCTVSINGNKSIIPIEDLQKDLVRMNNYIERLKKDKK